MPGDVVLLEVGSRVPADVRLVAVRNLRIEEAALTGESAPVGKHVEQVEPNAALADRRCMAYSGTSITSGSGRVWWSQRGKTARWAGSGCSCKVPSSFRHR